MRTTKKTELRRAAQIAVEKAGGPLAMVQKIKEFSGVRLARENVYHWFRAGIPVRHINAVSSITGLSRSYLRPDHYPKELERPRRRAAESPGCEAA